MTQSLPSASISACFARARSAHQNTSPRFEYVFGHSPGPWNGSFAFSSNQRVRVSLYVKKWMARFAIAFRFDVAGSPSENG